MNFYWVVSPCEFILNRQPVVAGMVDAINQDDF